MEATESRTTTTPVNVPEWVVLLRHLVGITAVTTVLHFLLFRGAFIGSSVAHWAVKVLVIMALALIANSAWALFFTQRSRGRFWANLVRLTWVFALLVAVGEWGSIRWRPAASIQAVPSANPLPPPERKVDELRRLYPRFSGLSDADMLRAVARDYPHVPIEKIAADLGVTVTRED